MSDANNKPKGKFTLNRCVQRMTERKESERKKKKRKSETMR